MEDREVVDDKGRVEEEDFVTRKTTVIEGLPPPPPLPMDLPPPPPPPPAASVRGISPARTAYSHHTSHHPHEDIRFVEKEQIVESNHIAGPLTVLSPSNRHRDSDDIRSEIRELEQERRLLRRERERVTDSDYELVEREDRWDEPRKNRARSKSVVRVEKDRKGRMALVRSTH